MSAELKADIERRAKEVYPLLKTIRATKDPNRAMAFTLGFFTKELTADPKKLETCKLLLAGDNF